MRGGMHNEHECCQTKPLFRAWPPLERVRTLCLAPVRVPQVAQLLLQLVRIHLQPPRPPLRRRRLLPRRLHLYGALLEVRR